MNTNMADAPRDGTRLLVTIKPDEYLEHSFYDDMRVFKTIAINAKTDTGVDEWQCCGWSWTHDCFTDFHVPVEYEDGIIIGWETIE